MILQVLYCTVHAAPHQLTSPHLSEKKKTCHVWFCCCADPLVRIASEPLSDGSALDEVMSCYPDPNHPERLWITDSRMLYVHDLRAKTTRRVLKADPAPPQPTDKTESPPPVGFSYPYRPLIARRLPNPSASHLDDTGIDRSDLVWVSDCDNSRVVTVHAESGAVTTVLTSGKIGHDSEMNTKLQVINPRSMIWDPTTPLIDSCFYIIANGKIKRFDTVHRKCLSVCRCPLSARYRYRALTSDRTRVISVFCS